MPSSTQGGDPHVFTVVLTGGIASGKTTVSDLFAKLGVAVIDTDVIAREMVAPGQPALQRVVDVFGSAFLDSDGSLNRSKMRHAIFSDAALRSRLENILHPLIAAEAIRRAGKVRSPYCMVVIPLYTESARWPWIDRVLVVDTPEAVQIQRGMERDGINHQQTQAILEAQADRSKRLALADDVISNDGTLAALQARVEELHAMYLALASRGA